MTNQQAIKALTEAKLFWDRIDFQTITVYTTGYRTTQCYNVEKFLKMAHMVVIDRKFDKLSGQTVTYYVHQIEELRAA